MNETSDPEIDEVLIEGNVNFKQGLRSRWEKIFASVYPNLLVVYTDDTKEIELFHFDPLNSWISSGVKSQGGLFVLNSEKESVLYLFEIGSDLLLHTWLQVLISAGWKSVTANVNYRSKQSNFRPTLVKIDSSSLSMSENFNTKTYEHERKASIERSASLPSLDSLLSLDDKINASNISTRPRSYMPLNDDTVIPPRSLRTSISESGYCSKESLTTDVERQKKLSRQDKVNSEAITNKDLADEKMVALSMDAKSNGTRTPVSKVEYHTKVDIDNNLEALFKEPTKEELRAITFELDDPDATPKLEKKASMSQIIYSLKSKFGSNSARKKGKKAPKRKVRQEAFSSRLLWNSNGQWKDKWFLYQDGVLSGYKDIGFKPADILIDVKTCILTSYGNDEMMHRLNLFRLTTSSNTVHIFAAWTEEQYESWIETLSYFAERRDHIDGKEFDHINKNSDAEDDGIIPYERALSNDQRKANSSSSENSSGLVDNNRIDSIDSGNDGDESGLESNVNSFDRRKRIEKEPKRIIRNTDNSKPMHETDETNMKPIDQTDNLNRSAAVKNLRLDFPRQVSLDSTTSTEYDSMKSPNSPNVEITPTSDDNTNHFTDTKKSKRPSFIYKQRWSAMFDKNGEKLRSKSNENLLAPRKKAGGGDQERTKSLSESKMLDIKTRDSNEHDLEFELANSLTGSADSPRSLRPGSADSSIRLRESSVDSTEHHWDVFDNDRSYKKCSIGSEDENSECSVPSMGSLPVTDEHKQDELEDTLREETLLRKRRNSLTLERGHIVLKIDTLKETNKKSHKQEAPVTQTFDKKEQIDNLEIRLEHIDSQIEIIDKRIDVNPTTYKQKKIKSSNNRRGAGNNIITKLRKGKQKQPIDNAYSMSIESLVSNGSQVSGRSASPYIEHQETQLHAHAYDKKTLNQTISMSGVSDCSELSTASQNSVDLTGIQELLLTTQKLENNKRLKLPPVNEPLSTSDKWRSKSVSSVDAIKNPVLDINKNQTTAESQLIIADFEQFSAMLANQMKQTYHDPIDV